MSVILSGSNSGYTKTDFNGNDTLSRQTDITFSFWIKIHTAATGTGQYRGVCGLGNALGQDAHFAGCTLNRTNVLYAAGHAETEGIALRDNNSWYHIVYSRVGGDAGQATLWCNGVMISQADRAIASDTSWTVSSIGAFSQTSSRNAFNSLGAYMSDVYFVEGSVLTPDEFARVDSNGRYVPKAFTGSLGDSGYTFLRSDGTADTPTESPTIITAGTSTDTDDNPTDNYAIFNVLDPRLGSGAITTGNSVIAATGTGQYTRPLNTALTSGKWYFEMEAVVASSAGNNGFGFMLPPTGFTNGKSLSGTTGGRTNPYGGGNTIANRDYRNAGVAGAEWQRQLNVGQAGDNPVAVTSPTDGVPLGGDHLAEAGDVMSALIDMDNHVFWVGVNGVWHNLTSTPVSTADVEAGNDGIPIDTEELPAYVPVIYWRNTQRPILRLHSNFTHTPPSGFQALTHANIVASQNDLDPYENFRVVRYTGDGAPGDTSGQSVTGVGFQPDLIWFKHTQEAQDWTVVDSVRGPTSRLRLNTNAHATTTGGFTSFDSDGFTLGAYSDWGNDDGDIYAAFCWRAGGAAVNNDNGDIESMVSVNNTAGFSMGTFLPPAGSSDGTYTIGHGLNQAPDLIILKEWDEVDGGASTGNWHVYSSSLGFNGDLFMDTSGARNTRSWGADPTDSVFSAVVDTGGGTLDPGSHMMFYAWHSVPGYSSFGTYQGAGSVDGSYIYTGFKPEFIIAKRVNSSGSWNVLATPLESDNPYDNEYLITDGNDAASNRHTVDILPNGFKLRTDGVDIGGSGGTYLYMAFAGREEWDSQMGDVFDFDSFTSAVLTSVVRNADGTLTLTFDMEPVDPIEPSDISFSGITANFENDRGFSVSGGQASPIASYFGILLQNPALPQRRELVIIRLPGNSDNEECSEHIESVLRDHFEFLQISDTGNGDFTITPAQFSQDAEWVVEVYSNSEQTEGHRENLASFIQRINDDEIVKTYYDETGALVTGTARDEFLPDPFVFATHGPANPDGTLMMSDIRVTVPGLVNQFSSDRPWPVDEVNLNIRKPIFATNITSANVDDNKLVASDIGYNQPIYHDTGVEAYESYVERIQMAITPEFDTEQLQSLALWADGGYAEFIGDDILHNRLEVRVQPTAHPGDVATDIRQSSDDYPVFKITQDYKADIRQHGRFLNYRITDNVSEADVDGFSQQTQWRLSGMQADIKKGGTR